MQNLLQYVHSPLSLVAHSSRNKERESGMWMLIEWIASFVHLQLLSILGLARPKKKMKQKMATFEDLSEDVLEMILEIVNANTEYSQEMARYSLVCRKLLGPSQRVLLKTLRMSRVKDWHDPDATVQHFKEQQAYDRVRSFVMACPSEITTSNTRATEESMQRMIQIAQDCHAPELTISGDGRFLRELNGQSFSGLTSLTLHLYGTYHWKYEHLVHIINPSAHNLRQLTVASNSDGWLTDGTYYLDPLPKLRSFTFIHNEQLEEPAPALCFLVQMVIATENGAKLKEFTYESPNITSRRLAPVIANLLQGVEILRLITVYADAKPDISDSVIVPLDGFLGPEYAPKLKRIEFNTHDPSNIHFIPPTLKELHVKLLGGPDQDYLKVMKQLQHEMARLDNLRLYDIWRYPQVVKWLRSFCEDMEVNFSTHTAKEFKVVDGRGQAKEDFVEGRYITYREQADERRRLEEFFHPKPFLFHQYLEELAEATRRFYGR